MNITELAERVATEQSLDKQQARKVIEATLKAVVEAAKGGAEVALPGFGKFRVQDRPEREGLSRSWGSYAAFTDCGPELGIGSNSWPRCCRDLCGNWLSGVSPAGW